MRNGVNEWSQNPLSSKAYRYIIKAVQSSPACKKGRVNNSPSSADLELDIEERRRKKLARELGIRCPALSDSSCSILCWATSRGGQGAKVFVCANDTQQGAPTRRPPSPEIVLRIALAPVPRNESTASVWPGTKLRVRPWRPATWTSAEAVNRTSPQQNQRPCAWKRA